MKKSLLLSMLVTLGCFSAMQSATAATTYDPWYLVSSNLNLMTSKWTCNYNRNVYQNGIYTAKQGMTLYNQSYCPQAIAS